MGSVCCVAARERDHPSGAGSGATRNQVCSPPWSFRRDNRRRVANEIEHATPSARDLATTPATQKSANSEMGTIPMSPLMAASLAIRSPSGVSLASPVRVEVKNLVDSPDSVSSALPNPSSSTSVCDQPSAHTHSLPPRPTPSGRAQSSPGQQLFRQASDSQTLGLKSPNNYATFEGRSSVSHSEGGLSGCSSSRFSCSPTVDRQTCGYCSKLLTERSSVDRFDLPVAAVLACGHVYHAECLETMTSETEKYDPMCPICTIGENQVAKISRKVLKAEAELRAKNYKRFKNRVVDSYASSEHNELVFQKMGKRERKALKMDPSSSTKGSSSKSFFKWNFGSISSKWSKANADDSTSNKSFWSRHSNKSLSHSSSSI